MAEFSGAGAPATEISKVFPILIEYRDSTIGHVEDEDQTILIHEISRIDIQNRYRPCFILIQLEDLLEGEDITLILRSTGGFGDDYPILLEDPEAVTGLCAGIGRACGKQIYCEEREYLMPVSIQFYNPHVSYSSDGVG